MSVLLDTNILTRMVQSSDAHNSAATAALAALLSTGERVFIAVQNLYEFWSVATRPPSSLNGLGLGVEQALEHMDNFRLQFTTLSEGPELFHEWRRLIVQHRVMGKAAHDARIVAAMSVHGIERLLTFNDADFKRYGFITTLHPTAVVG